ncbi:C1 family peptidase [Atopobium fossor]|uniref:aminopeptidase C n=1 Tax=Atopobium fossor TaxID=39487 RepID=UPI0004085A3B|nr:C1 family peptidase [Atopobium fossor]
MSLHTVDPAWAATQNESFASERANRVARNAVTSMNVMAAARDYNRMRTYHDSYSVELKTAPITNQRQSGRCWLFSAYNVARTATMKLLDVDSFEFSQAYGMFYDKLEKANAMLENIIRLADKPNDDRELMSVLSDGMGDGGYWIFAMNLINKWGMVPKDVMPETASSKSSAQMNAQLERLLRKDASILRKEFAAGFTTEQLQKHKQQMLADVYKLLSICLGEPPTHFNLETRVGKNCKVDTSKLVTILPTQEDTDAKDPKRMLRDLNITPQEFAQRYVPFNPYDYAELVCIPSSDSKLNTPYHVCSIDSVEGGRPNRFLNVEQSVLEQAAIAQLKAGEPVSMACDVMQEYPRNIEDFKGVLAMDGVDLDGLFGMELGMSRTDMLDMGETSLTHAMTFQGVELDEKGAPVAWRVENSWGKDSGKDGYLYMSAEWFCIYGGEVVVRREFLPSEIRDLWDNAPAEECAPWSGFALGVGQGK